VQGDRQVTYGQVWTAARDLADRLRRTGVERGDGVAVALPRGAELVVSVLGTWLAGAAYLPIDVAHPEERIRYQLTDSGARVLLAESGPALVATGDQVLLPPPVIAAAQAPACWASSTCRASVSSGSAAGSSARARCRSAR
jgi:non-ribosomal peptide synthetase component F